jgi:UDP-N-acetyl-D-mannosaminuronate dehydrogenase
VELLQLVEELGEPEPEAIVAELDGEVDDDHDDSHPEKITFLGVALKEKFQEIFTTGFLR